MSTHGHPAGRAASGHPLAELTARLRRGERKVTGPRQAILDLLRRSQHPLTRKQVFARLRAGDCDLATVYRSMQVLEEMGIVKRYDFGDGVGRFELVAEGEDGHHHHLICTRCSQVVELDGCFLADLEGRIAERNGFRDISHRLEFFGICPTCQTTVAPAARPPASAGD